jgi:hypothetical protein
MLVREFSCPGCRKRLRLDAGLIGPRVKCPKCGAWFVFPAKAALRLRHGRRPELLKLVMSRSRN